MDLLVKIPKQKNMTHHRYLNNLTHYIQVIEKLVLLIFIQVSSKLVLTVENKPNKTTRTFFGHTNNLQQFPHGDTNLVLIV